MLLLRLLLFSLWCNLFVVSRFMVDLNARTGNNVTLSCSGELDTEHDAQWWFNFTLIANSTCYKNFVRSSTQRIMLQVSPECEGNIYCARKNTALLTNDSMPRPLYAYPVVKNDSVAVVKVKEGASVVLDCRLQISALNNIVVSWNVQRLSCPIEPRQAALNNYSLVLENINSSHSGTYTCAGSARHFAENKYLQYDSDYVKKETVTLLEVEEFRPPRFVSNLTAEKEADDTMVFSVEAAEGSSPISYRLLIDNTIHNKAVELSEGENIQLKINISSLVSSVSIITVVASNEDRNGHRHATAIGSVVITQQGVAPTSTTVLPDGWSAECLGGSGAGGFALCLFIVIVFAFIILFVKKRQSKTNQTHDFHMQQEDVNGSTRGGSSSVMPTSYTGTHSETHFSMDSANVYRHPPSPLAIVLMTVATIMHMKEQQPELQLLTSLEKVFAEILTASRSGLVVMLNEQVDGILEEKKKSISKKKNNEETSRQTTAEVNKLESIAKMLNTWVKTHKSKNHSGSSISDSPVQGNNMANIFILLSHLLQVSRSPNYVCFTFLEEIIPLTLQGIYMVDDRVIEQVHDLQEQLEKLNSSLSRGPTAEDRQIIQSIGNSHDTVLAWIQQCRRH